MTLTRRILALLALSIWLGALPASAMLVEDDISGPLPETMQKPLTAFLEATGWQEGARLAGKARYWQVLDHIFLVRIVDKSTCDQNEDLCLTLIGSLRNGGLVSEAVFFAGPKAQFVSSAEPLIDRSGPILFQIRFFGKMHAVTVAASPTGWIIVPSRMEAPKN